MISNKVAILIDGGFFKVKFRAKNGSFPWAKDVGKFIGDLMNEINVKSDPLEENILFRSFYYDSKPYGGKETDPAGKVTDYGSSKAYIGQNGLIKDLKKMDLIALRLGEVSFDGWKVTDKGNYYPDFKQKSVDMKIGLDIAWMSSKRTIDKLVLVAGDSDFVTPMKWARKEGIKVVLQPLGQKNLKLNLIEHSDILLDNPCI